MAANKGMFGRMKLVNQALFPQFESLKQGKLAKVVNLYSDYKRAFTDTVSYVKTKPLRVSFYGCLVGAATLASYVNPDFISYRDKLLDASNNHSLISDAIRNKMSNNRIMELMGYYSQDRLKRVNLGVCSLILLEPVSDKCDVFEKHCSCIQSRWIKLDDWKERILDIGFAGTWLYLERAMVDFDVNEEEFACL